VALTGLQPYEQSTVFDNTETGSEGRDPSNWGTPNDPAHGVLGSGDTATPASGFQMAPGDEFAFGDIEDYLTEGYHGHVLDTTPINPPGIGEDVPVPVTGYGTPHDERHWEAEAGLVEAHSQDSGGPLRAVYVNPPAPGRESVTAWQMLATNRGAVIGGPYNDSGLQVSSPGSMRPALDLSTHNRAKMLLRPVVPYGERPWFNNIAAITAASEPPRTILSPGNDYPDYLVKDPGPGTVYQSPPDPQMVPATASQEVPGGLEWM
jgi:hypothetical protein